MKKNTTNKLVLSVMTGAILITSQMASAHTRLQLPSIDENQRVYNNQVISHGCKDASGSAVIDTLGTVVLFPNGTDSSITVDGVTVDKPLTDFVTNWGDPVDVVQNKDVFTTQSLINDDLGNTLGYWAAGGQLTAGFKGVIPFRTSSIEIEPSSCAKTVKFIVAIADICELTDVDGFNDAAVMLWTPAVGSKFDGTEDLNGYNSPASLTVNRTSDLDASCGDGESVVVTHSAAQLDHDMTIKIDGVQVWPTHGEHMHTDSATEHSNMDTDTNTSTGEGTEHVHP